MQQLSPSGEHAVRDIAQRHGFSVDATLNLLRALQAGNGSMAQFNHAEFAGAGQWMRGGMTMVSDLFNHTLAGRVDALCRELSERLASHPDDLCAGGPASQQQGGGPGPAGTGAGAAPIDRPAEARRAGWPEGLGRPDASGAQNGVRYAYFSGARRLVIEQDGAVTVYDTGDHRIGGVSQQQSGRGTLSFDSQLGRVDLASLTVVSPRAQPAPNAVRSAPGAATPGAAPTSRDDVLATLERLGTLKDKGVLSESEFAAKKAELLGRL